jgi:hypothetical protein
LKFEQPAEFRYWLGMIIHTQIDGPVTQSVGPAFFPDNKNGGRLLATLVTPCLITSVEGSKKPGW